MRGLIGAMNVAIGATNASVAALALTMRGIRTSDAALAAFSNAVEKRFAATDASIAALRLETEIAQRAEDMVPRDGRRSAVGHGQSVSLDLTHCASPPEVRAVSRAAATAVAAAA